MEAEGSRTEGDREIWEAQELKGGGHGQVVIELIWDGCFFSSSV